MEAEVWTKEELKAISEAFVRGVMFVRASEEKQRKLQEAASSREEPRITLVQGDSLGLKDLAKRAQRRHGR
jgi:hypothetical protein